MNFIPYGDSEITMMVEDLIEEYLVHSVSKFEVRV